MQTIKYRKAEEMKDSGVEWINIIPINWENETIGKLGRINTSSVDKKVKETERTVKLVNYMDVYKNSSKEITKEIKFMEVTANKNQISSSQVHIGDVIFTPSSETSEDIGHSAVIKEFLENTLFSYHVVRLSFIKYVDNDFKKYLFNNHFVLNQFSSKATGTTRMTLSKNDFKYTNVFLPPLEEQQKIANFLDIKTVQFESIISKKEKLIEKLEEAKKSLISEVVTGKAKIVGGQLVKRQPEEMKDSRTIFGQIPMSWTKSKMKFEISIKARIGWKGLTASEYVDQGYLFLATPNIKGRDIDFTNVNYIDKKRYDESPEIKLKEGDVLLAKDGSTLGTVNVVRKLNLEGTVNSSIAVLRKKNNMNSVFLYYLLMSQPMISKINRMKDGMGVPHLFQADIKEFDLIIPSSSEMDEISKYLDLKTKDLQSTIEKANYQIQKLKQAKQSLISEAVTGKIDLRDWEIIEEGE